MKPFLSIVIPTLNEEKYLPKILSDLRRQKEKDFEVIIIDGKSKDRTKEVARRYADLPLKYFVSKKSQVSHQRNFGAGKAKGQYIVFIDADSGVSPAFIRQLKKYIKKHRSLIYIPSIVPENGNDQLKPLFKVINFLVEFSQNLSKPLSSGGSMIWERNFFHLVGGFDESLFISEDHRIIQKAYEWGIRARFLRHIYCRFCLRRMKKEGQLRVFYKYLLTTAYLLIKGDTKKALFDYQMGGANYQKIKKQLSFDQQFKRYLRQIKSFFESL